MVNQILIASNMIALCEGLLYGYKAGLDSEDGVQVGRRSARPGARSLDILGPRILHRNFEPGFYVEHFIKDMGIALAEAERMNLCLPGLALAKQLYEAVQAQGYGRKGTHALMLALEKISNVTACSPAASSSRAAGYVRRSSSLLGLDADAAELELAALRLQADAALWRGPSSSCSISPLTRHVASVPLTVMSSSFQSSFLNFVSCFCSPRRRKSRTCSCGPRM